MDSMHRQAENHISDEAAAAGFFRSSFCGSPTKAMDTIRRRPHGFKYCPEEFKTQEMCDAAFAALPETFEYIPNKFKTQEMCDEAINVNHRFYYYVPDEFRCSEMSYWVGYRDANSDSDLFFILRVMQEPDEYTSPDVQAFLSIFNSFKKGLAEVAGRPDRHFSYLSGEYTSDMLKGIEEDERAWYAEVAKESLCQIDEEVAGKKKKEKMCLDN